MHEFDLSASCVSSVLSLCIFMRAPLPKPTVCVWVWLLHICWRCEFSRCEVPVHSYPHIPALICDWHIRACIHRQTHNPACLWIHRHSVPCFSRPTFLSRCDHTSPSLPPHPSLPLTLSSSVPLPSLTLTVTSRLRWHLISISLPPQTCNICSPLFFSSPLFSRVLPVSAPPLREHAACVIFCTVTLLCQQPKRNVHQSQETFLPQIKKKRKIHTHL